MDIIALYAIYRLGMAVGAILVIVWVGMMWQEQKEQTRLLRSMDESLKQLPAVRRHEYQKAG